LGIAVSFITARCNGFKSGNSSLFLCWLLYKCYSYPIYVLRVL